jgi:putative ABC transport system permease protein
VGVLAPGAELLFPPTTNVERWPDVWIALRLNFEGASRINVFLRLIGRLKPGVTVTQAQSQMDGIAADLRKRFPIKETAGLHFRLEPMQQDLVADVRPAILALMGAVIFVLLISCANVANLLLVRAARRERELALRSALGGTRWRLVRQMLTESLVLAVGGGVLGLGLAWLGIRLLASMGPASLPRLDAVAIDPLVLVFSAGASLAAAVIFGVVPALRASRPNAIEALRPTGRASGGRAGRWLRDSVVMVEVALSFVLLIGSGLMFRSFLALVRTDPGYDPAGILTFSVPTPRGPAQQRAAFIQTLHDRLAGLPGVQAVTAATPLPLDGLLANARWGTEAAVADPTRFQQANLHMVLPGYFEALRTRLLSGRVFTAADNDSSVMSLIVDDRLAAKAFPGRQAVGQRLYVRARGNEPEWYDIIGVVAHQRHVSLTSDGPEAIFLTDGHMGSGAVNRWAVRTAGNPTALAGPIRAVVTALDPLLPVSEVQPMTALVDKAMAPTRFALVLIGIFAAIAGVLAVVGLYGVLSSSVSQRTAEIGVRVALGAPRSSILQLVIGQGLRLSGVGIGLGLVGAFALTRVINTMLVGVKATDPLTFGSMVVIFFGIAWFACWVPARRAAGLDPTVALRED